MKLTVFDHQPFLKALKVLFADLNVPVNYIADEPTSAKEILKDTYKDNESFRLIDDVYFVGMVDDDAFEGNKSLAVEKIKSDYDGVLVFGVTLSDRPNNLLPTRSQLADISRAFNREYYYTPVIIVFKYGEHLAFANTERLKYKQEWREGEKAGKVTLLRDVNIKRPHSGHERILLELKIPTSGSKKVNSFAELYTYWQEVFSVNVLNKKFYQELSNWYFWAIKQVTFPGEPTAEKAHAQKAKLEDLLNEHKATNVIRLLTRLLFVWFIKEKKLIPEELFDLQSLQKDVLNEISPYHEEGIFKQANQDSVYYKAILQNLFFASLNCPIEADGTDNRTRGFRGLETYGKHRGVDWMMRYKSSFKKPETFLKMMNATVPFLNGGLFECLDDKEKNIYIDGFSDQMTKGEQLIVPDYLFFGTDEEVDLSAEYGIKNKGTKQAAVKGLINILKSYKFTITENTPIEEDVALDPELLGKVFENLLASYNPETKTTARKQTGSFYTPREIVNYMVDESLIAYLKNKILQDKSGDFLEFGKAQFSLFGNEAKKGQASLYEKGKAEFEDDEVKLDDLLHKLISFDPGNPFEDFPKANKAIIEALDECKILDPACGSGAFPMGILQKMVHILQKLDPNNTIWREVQKQKVKEETNEAFEIEDHKEREDKLIEINNAFDERVNDPDYARKLYLIENCIYGVDIQPIATQISKLRFFISLVVDQKVNKEEQNFGIRPLPNLETKFVAANTLIGIDRPKEGDTFNIFQNDHLKGLESQLKKIRHKLFSARTKDTKLKYRQKDEELRTAIADKLKKNGWQVDTATKLAGWDPYDQNESSTFFDPEWMFDISEGFDVVIGNPPYVFGGSEKISDSEKKYFKSNFASGTQKINLFAIFIEKGIQLLKNECFISYIIPNTLLRVTSYSNIRKYIYENSIISEVNDLDVGVFEGVTASTIIIRLQKHRDTEKNNLIVIKKGVDSEVYQRVEQSEYGNKGFILDIFTKKNDRLILKYLSNKSTSLGELTKMIRFGVVITKNIDEVVSNSQLGGLYKPFLEGDEITSFGVNYKGRFLLYDPALLHRSRTPDVFEENKIMIQRITGGSKPIKAAFDNSGYYNKESILNLQLLSDEFSYYYILALLNSSTINWFYKQKFTNNSKLTVNLSKEYLEQIPIKKCDSLGQSALVIMGKLLSYSYKKKIIFSVFYRILDALVFNLYFPDHMKEREIDVLEFVERDMEQALQGREFDSLSVPEKEKVIDQLHKTWSHSDNEVRNRIKLFAVRSPEILKPILES